MQRYAQLSNNVVANVIEAETNPDGTNGAWVLCGNAGPVWTYDGTAFHAPIPAPIPRYLSPLAFMSRFTDAEAIAIDLASMGATVGAATLRRYLSKVSAAKFIDLDFAETVAGVQALEAATLLATGRATVILGATVQPGEKP